MRWIKLRVMTSAPDPGGAIDFLCGQCAHKLAAKVPTEKIRTFVLKCPSCGAFNDTDQLGPN